MALESLYLDPAIRDWVLFPITLVMILVGVLRHYVTQLLNSSPKPQPRKAIREQRAVVRSQILRATAPESPIPPTYYHSISSSLSGAFAAGSFLKDGPPKEDDKERTPPNPLSDPSQMEGMMDGMKKQMVMMVPQMVIMGWINFFFQGFVLIKLPFPLTLGWKPMMQRGIETPDMDVRWVSSLSWYFLNLFGLNGLFRLILGSDNAAADQQSMGASPFAAASGATPGAPQDFVKLFAGERDNLDLSEGLYHWMGADVERRVLERWGKIPKRDAEDSVAPVVAANKRKTA
ncbi:transmembrane protein [Calocera viscosa TUFC12733]|uniref:ER membrane protein complex subunit 3 n=1 Tax=Calocera viscosa (strain TUFC12733) TaxID=1330018 RepID=A0A167QLT7_CALVF|nr:transmembrane protein [Calocera viscosa TUFC12733]